MACTKDVGLIKQDALLTNYPQAVGDILVNKCAVSGCHNSISKGAAAGLNLQTWNSLFEGGNSGAAVIAYRPDHSTLMYYTNSYNEFGTIQLQPKMPFNSQPLSKDEVKIINEWIKAGAPGADGKIRFADNSSNKKFYVANRGCDLVTIFDAKSMLAARYIDVGETRGIESPTIIKVAPDNRHWYVSFVAGGYFIKYSVSDNKQAGKVNLGPGNWFSLLLSPDSKTAYLADRSANGKIAVVDLVNMSAAFYTGFSYPHGLALNQSENTLFVSSQFGNYIYKANTSNLANPQKINIDGNSSTASDSGPAPHDLMLSPDSKKLFISCQSANQVRVLSAESGSLITVIPVGKTPQKMSLSLTTPYLFVCCTEDNSFGSTQKSSVAILNYQTNTLVKTIHAGFESSGIVVDDENKRVYVSNRNVSAEGPAPHHQSLCSGKNGYITAIDLNTLELIKGFRTEVSNDPFYIEMGN